LVQKRKRRDFFSDTLEQKFQLEVCSVHYIMTNPFELHQEQTEQRRVNRPRPAAPSEAAAASSTINNNFDLHLEVDDAKGEHLTTTTSRQPAASSSSFFSMETLNSLVDSIFGPKSASTATLANNSSSNNSHGSTAPHSQQAQVQPPMMGQVLVMEGMPSSSVSQRNNNNYFDDHNRRPSAAMQQQQQQSSSSSSSSSFLNSVKGSLSSLWSAASHHGTSRNNNNDKKNFNIKNNDENNDEIVIEEDERSIGSTTNAAPLKDDYNEDDDDDDDDEAHGTPIHTRSNNKQQNNQQQQLQDYDIDYDVDEFNSNNTTKRDLNVKRTNNKAENDENDENDDENDDEEDENYSDKGDENEEEENAEQKTKQKQPKKQQISEQKPQQNVDEEEDEDEDEEFPVIMAEMIGQGGFGKVYKATFDGPSTNKWQLQMGTIIAVKEIELLNQNNNNSSKEAIKEIEFMERLRHPNIIQYYHAETQLESLEKSSSSSLSSLQEKDKNNLSSTSSKLRIFMEYAPYGTLNSLAKSFTVKSELLLRSYIMQILIGLSYLHRQNVCHRDIKGSNILVAANGVLKLSDFGASKLIESKSTVSSTSLGICGTPAYMAPELISGTVTRENIFKTDIWAFGCTMVELITGKVPWFDEMTEFSNVFQIMFKISQSKHCPRIPLSYTISPLFRSFIESCFIIDPAKRPTVDQLLDHEFLTCPDEQLQGNEIREVLQVAEQPVAEQVDQQFMQQQQQLQTIDFFQTMQQQQVEQQVQQVPYYNYFDQPAPIVTPPVKQDDNDDDEIKVQVENFDQQQVQQVQQQSWDMIDPVQLDDGNEDHGQALPDYDDEVGEVLQQVEVPTTPVPNSTRRRSQEQQAIKEETKRSELASENDYEEEDMGMFNFD